MRQLGIQDTFHFPPDTVVAMQRAWQQAHRCGFWKGTLLGLVLEAVAVLIWRFTR
jgi:hypothetical protein